MKVCSRCGQRKSVEEFKGKSKRQTRMCRECRELHSQYQQNSVSRCKERKIESFSLAYCPWETGEIRPVPFGGVM